MMVRASFNLCCMSVLLLLADPALAFDCSAQIDDGGEPPTIHQYCDATGANFSCSDNAGVFTECQACDTEQSAASCFVTCEVSPGVLDSDQVICNGASNGTTAIETAYCACLVGGTVPVAECRPKYFCDIDEGTGDATWGDGPHTADPIRDSVPPNGGVVKFFWTWGMYEEGQPVQPHPSYWPCEEANNSGTGRELRFIRPDDDTITDWQQTVTDADGTSEVYGGNIEQNSPWAFHPLSELPEVAYQIPDLAPSTGVSTDTIYAAVNLRLYYANNPLGFAGGSWTSGDTLDGLGVSIVNGQVAGLDGIYWSTTPFTFDPNSSTGWVPTGGALNWLDSAAYQLANGDIRIIAAHEGRGLKSVPSMSRSTWLLTAVALTTLGAIGIRLHTVVV